MSLEPGLEEQELLAGTYRGESAPMDRRERAVEIAAGAAFILAAAGIWVAEPPHSLPIVATLLCTMVTVLASRVRFDTPFGYTVVMQLGFVPLVFVLPPALVPPVVAVALVLAGVPDVISGEIPAQRLLLAIGNAWFSIGPALVLVAAGTTAREAGAGILIAALLAQFALDFLVSSARSWLVRSASFSSQLRETWVYAIDAALSGIGLVVGEDMHRTPLVALAVLPLLGLFSVFARERNRRMQSLVELNDAYRGTALVLGDVVETDDNYTGEHSRSVVRLAIALGEQLGLDAEQERNLEFAALLHDVGKLAIPKAIINKPGKLTPEEWALMATHTIEGQKMLDQIGGFMTKVGQIVRSHHERWDGGGYPDGLAEDQIPLESRIITCCDSWNAMRTDRSYRLALSPPVARAQMIEHAGLQFDPEIVPVFLSLLGDLNEFESVPAPVPPRSPAVLAGSQRRAFGS
jgi:putative nucleotidyltransferase with HDIG domain